jgi:hypothetical protein
MDCNISAFTRLQQEITALHERWGRMQAVTIQDDSAAPDALCLYSELELEGDTVLWLNQRLQGWESAHFSAAVRMHTSILLCGHQLRGSALQLLEQQP